MANVYKGQAGLIIVGKGVVRMNKYGEHTATCTFKAKAESASLNLFPDKGNSHPFATWLKFTKRTISFTPGFWTCVCEYKGADTDGGLPDPVYELSFGTGEEPIETHANFESDIGGVPSAPLNGAVFVDAQGNITDDDAVGVFDRFRLKNPTVGGRSFGGVESYVDMNNITWSKTYVTKTSQDQVGGEVEIQIPEDGGAGFQPPTFDDRDWLYLGMSSTGTIGGSATHRKVWRLSAPGGWNPDIYKKVPTQP